MSSSSETIDPTNITETPRFEHYNAIFNVLPRWNHALCSKEVFQSVSSEVRKNEVNLNIKICLDCGSVDWLTTLTGVIQEMQQTWFALSMESQAPFDEADVNAKRWELTIVYIESIVQGFQDQIKERVHEIVYSNHLHNAERGHYFKLRYLQTEQQNEAEEGGTVKAPEYWMTQVYDIDMGLARMKGDCLGRAVADQIRPNPEPASVPHVPGDICITLSQRKSFGDSSLLIDEMPDVITIPVAA
jgi:hypothetical protein